MEILNSITIFDTSVVTFFGQGRTELWTYFFKAMTWLCQPITVLLMGIVFICYLYRYRLRGYIIPLCVSVVSSTLFTLVLKEFVRRPRPPQILATLTESGYSFPSAHASIALAFYGFFFFILYRETRFRSRKTLFLLVGNALVFFIGLSRVYLGVHYPSDVIAGFSIGFISLVAGLSLYKHSK